MNEPFLTISKYGYVLFCITVCTNKNFYLFIYYKFKIGYKKNYKLNKIESDYHLSPQ